MAMLNNQMVYIYIYLSLSLCVTACVPTKYQLFSLVSPPHFGHFVSSADTSAGHLQLICRSSAGHTIVLKCIERSIRICRRIQPSTAVLPAKTCRVPRGFRGFQLLCSTAQAEFGWKWCVQNGGADRTMASALWNWSWKGRSDKLI